MGMMAAIQSDTATDRTDTEDAAIDLTTGEVHGDTPVCDVDVVSDGPGGRDWVLYWVETLVHDRESRTEPVALLER
jgi:hypothetical protein